MHASGDARAFPWSIPWNAWHYCFCNGPHFEARDLTSSNHFNYNPPWRPASRFNPNEVPGSFSEREHLHPFRTRSKALLRFPERNYWLAFWNAWPYCLCIREIVEGRWACQSKCISKTTPFSLASLSLELVFPDLCLWEAHLWCLRM
jgi:hypothetical protein